MKDIRIVIELKEELKVHCEGIDNLMEGLGILRLAEHTLITYFDEKIGLTEMIEQ